LDWGNQTQIESLAEKTGIVLKKPEGDKKDGRSVTVLLNGSDVSWEVRTQEIAEGASIVSQYPGVRKTLVKKQQQMARNQNVIMEGRDIGTRVLKNAQLKIFMTADVDKRIKWKQGQMKLQGQNIPLSEVKKALIKRDKREMERKIDPLRPAKDAWMLDTSDLTIDEIVDQVIKKANRPKT
jgi:cytidylate kinase